jgi:acyl carrier protein
MTPTAEKIQQWIVDRVSLATNVPPVEVDPRDPLTRYGLDSVALIAMAADLETWLGYQFRENPVDAHPTIESLARFLAAEVARQPRS